MLIVSGFLFAYESNGIALDCVLSDLQAGIKGLNCEIGGEIYGGQAQDFRVARVSGLPVQAGQYRTVVVQRQLAEFTV
ncbi:MAG: hypothetical protein HHJ12_00445 [Glaciimonas sp.]|nr:hypothetical protein [Glaciimonas sp.]